MSPPPPFPLADAPSPATDTVKIKWRDFGAVKLFHPSQDYCRASRNAINGHSDYLLTTGPDIGCDHVSALLPPGGESATQLGHTVVACNEVCGFSFFFFLNFKRPLLPFSSSLRIFGSGDAGASADCK